MVDEQNTHLDEQTSDGGRSLADDAVSNRSDDTALDESRASSTYRNGNGPAEPAQPSGDEEGRLDAASGSASAEPLDAQSTDELTDEQAAAESIENEEEPSRPPAPPVEIADDTPEDIHMDWYILKVQSNRKRSRSSRAARRKSWSASCTPATSSFTCTSTTIRGLPSVRLPA
jgi:hypothetical protein